MSTPTDSIGQALDPRRNSLNFLRLAFALFVVVGHAATLGGYHWQVQLGPARLEDIAVDGFFAISGYLIAGSALRSTTPRFLWQRLLRIMPGYWVSLLTVVFGFALVGWLHDHGGLSGYWSGPHGALFYLSNADLRVRTYDINGSPVSVPFPGAWNGSVWTLWLEFLCYLVVGALAFVKLLPRRAVVLGLFLMTWGLEWLQHFRHSGAAANELRFIPIFLAGSVLYLYRDRVRDSWKLFAAMTVAWIVVCQVGYSGNLAGPLMALPCIWLGAHLPLQKVGADHDISYGVYIYAYPVTQILALWGVARWGALPFLVLITVPTLLLAAISWKVVEAPALRLKKWSPVRRGLVDVVLQPVRRQRA